MAETSYPFPAVPATVSRWGRMARTFAPPHVVGTLAQNSYGLTVAGLNLTIGRGSLGVAEAFVRGFFHVLDVADWTVAVPANTNATLSRIDRIVLRLDPSTETVVLALVQGTPAASPVATPLVQGDSGIFELPLWRFTVPPNSGSPVTGLIDERPFYVASTEPRIVALGSTANNVSLTNPEARIVDAGLTVSPLLSPGRLYEAAWNTRLSTSGGGTVVASFSTLVRAIAGSAAPATASTAVASSGFTAYTTSTAIAQTVTSGYFTVASAGVYTFSPFAAAINGSNFQALGPQTLIVRDAGPASGVVGVTPVSIA